MKTKLIISAAVAALSVATLAQAAPAAQGPHRTQLGTWGVDMTGRKDTIAPGQDFFGNMNGRWVETTAIPDDRSSWGSFVALDDLSEKRVRAIIEGVANAKGRRSAEQAKIGVLYKAYLDTATIEAKGLTPFMADLKSIDTIATPADLAKAFGQTDIMGWNAPIGGGIAPDFKNPDVYAVFLGQGGLGMPNRDYYLKTGKRYDELRAAYLTYIETMLKQAGHTAAADEAKAIMALETKIAEIHWPPEDQRDPVATYNPMTLAELQAFAPGIDWATMLKAAGVDGQKQFVVAEKSAFPKLAKLTAETPISVWKSYLAFHYLSGHADVMPKAFDDARFAFYGKAVSGQPTQRERWKRGVDAVEGGLGEALGKIYVARYFQPESKAKMDALVANLMKAYDARIQKLDWMGEGTRKAALEKLHAYTVKIAYPNTWRDYAGLKIAAGDAAGNDARVRKFNVDYMLSKLGKPVDRTEWGMTPQTVNAYYNPSANEIVFPAAILQPPFFDPNADPAVNYGGIGAVIGHEISHGFDDEGSQFDAKGALRDWWTAEDKKAFEAKTAALSKQYAGYEPLPGVKINGDLTLGENIADLAGLTVAYHAYQMSLGGKPAPVIDGLTGDQRFFMGWAQVWRGKYRDDALRQRLLTDPHSPPMYRVNGIVRNLDPWYAAYGVKAGDAMYLDTAQRVRVW
jgi:predicted metalloendopeptidase